MINCINVFSKQKELKMKKKYHFLVILILFNPLVTIADQINYNNSSGHGILMADNGELNSYMSNKKVDSKDAKNTKKVEVVSYNAKWPKIYEVEANLIKQKLAENVIAIHHIGSTSVPGLAAKPIIDIIVAVKDPKGSIIDFESIGYQYKGEHNIPFHFGFTKMGNTKIHLHVFPEGNPEIELNLLFRDYLRSHPETLKEYAQLKAFLLTQKTSFEKNNSIFKGYTLGKDTFIRKVLQNAGFNKIRIMHCTHIEEWETAKAFRQKYVFDKIQVSDPYDWTFNHPEHIHLALYQGTKIIGYAHLQLLTEKRAVIRMCIIDEPFRNQDFEGKFLTLFEQWLKLQGYESLYTASSPDTHLFYEKHGYKETSFNDPDGYGSDPRDTAMWKRL